MDRIVIGGGDGTISSALPELLALGKPLAVLPLGTANDFAATIGLPADPLEAADVALHGRPHAIDVGLANDRPFLNVASVGVATLGPLYPAQDPIFSTDLRLRGLGKREGTAGANLAPLLQQAQQAMCSKGCSCSK